MIAELYDAKAAKAWLFGTITPSTTTPRSSCSVTHGSTDDFITVQRATRQFASLDGSIWASARLTAAGAPA
jgi:hypothetical protein